MAKFTQIALSESSSSDLPLERLLRIMSTDPNYVCSYLLDQNGDIAVSLSISQWVEKSYQLSQVLKSRGIQKEDRVILSLPTSEAFLVSFLALWWIGAVPVPLPEPSPRIKRGSFHERLIHVIADCTPKALIVPKNGRQLFFEVEELAAQLSHVLTWEWPDLINDASPGTRALHESYEKAEPTSPAFIQYTSGSTGIPKGVVVTHGSIRANSLAMGAASGMSERDRILTWMPLYHDMGLVGGVLFPSYFKTPFYLIPTHFFLGNPKIWLKAISQHRITLSTSPNFVYNLCGRRINPTDLRELDLSCWRLAYNGAEPIDLETLRLFSEKFKPYGFSKTAFYPVYGMAEATLGIAFPTPGTEIKVDRVKRKDLNEFGTAIPTSEVGNEAISLVSVGTCLPEHQIVIRDPQTGEVKSERQVGEICFSGPSVCPGYYRDRKWLTEPLRELKTGDLGYLAQGQLYIVDRIKDLILIAGANFYPSDIEREVHQIPGIRPGRSVAFGTQEEGTGTSALVIIAEIDREVDENQLKKEIRNRIFSTHGLIPRDIVLTRQRSIPLTSSGKIMRRRCHELYLKGEMLVLSLRRRKTA